MKHLSGMDALFLHMESAEMPTHVGSLHVLQLPEGYDGDFFEEVKQYLTGRLHLATVFTRKLAFMPFDLSDPDTVDLGLVPDFPASRADAVARAKQQRFEVKIMEVGLRAARIQDQRDLLSLLGLGKVPVGLGFKNAGPGNGGIALGAIFGTAYDVPLRGFDASATVAVPALGAIWLHWEPQQQVETSAGGEA